MPHGYLKPPFVRECNQPLRLSLVKCEWLFHIDVAPGFQAKLGDLEMALRRRRDMNNIWPSSTEEFCHVAKRPLDREPLVELARHQRLTVTHPNDLAPLDPLNLRSVRVGDFAASHDGDFKHVVLWPGRLRNSDAAPPPWTALAS